jgi:type II secretory pathway component GspD/PulD (secretin)
MKKNLWISIGVVVVLILGWGTYAAIRAHSKLVTLNVHNADVRQVVRKIEWQTWEDILVQKGVEGKITLNVHRVPLEEVLNLIEEQTSARWSAMYPLYSSGKSLSAFKKSLRGDINPVENGWTNLSALPFPGGFGGGMFGDTARNENKLISLQLDGKDLDLATHALGRYSQARVIPEDGTAGTVRLSLVQATMPQAVAKLAKSVHRKWALYYALQSGRGGRRGGEVADGTNGFPRGELTPEQLAEREKRFQAQLETMTAEERAKAEADRLRREAMRNMSPEDRRKAFEQMAQNPEFKARMENRMLNGIRDTTPEQRVDRAQRMAQRRARRGG